MISQQEAAKLVKTGQWIYDTSVPSPLDVLTELIPEESSVWEDLKLIDHLNSASLVNENKNLALGALGSSVESMYITQTQDDYNVLALRVKQYRVFKVATAAKDGLPRFLALVVAGMLFTPLTGPIGWVTPAVAAIDFVNAMAGAYEKIGDPDDMLVFELIYKLQRRPVIIDYDAYTNNQYNLAYGHRWPTEEELSSEVNGQLTAKELEKALSSLSGRSIVKKRQGRWTITL